METDNKLLIRIDERQIKMSEDIDEIKKSLDCTVKNNDDFKAFKKKVDTLWDERNKLLGWMMGAGLVGGVTGSFLKNLVSGVFEK